MRGATGPDPSSVRLAGPWTHRDISANGIRLHVAECGTGPLVVLLHGFPEFWWAWRYQLTGLSARGFRVVAADLRGYGASDKPPRGYDLWTLAGDVGGLIGALGETSAHVVGHGWGGAIGWTLATLHPRRVRSLAVLAAPHPMALRAAVVHEPRGQGRATARHVLGFQVPRWPERSLRLHDGAGAERIMRAWSGRQWAGSVDFEVAVQQYRSAIRIHPVAHCSLEYFRWAARSQLRSDGRRYAAAMATPVDVPVLQVHGAADPWVLAATAAASDRWISRPRPVHVLPEVGHFPHEERPTETTAVLADFLG
ncbi:alpha/beta fold hydrolase [Pseudonocardia sp. TRM90224]|uniref:alpha/beta fold hydrolase n=1 Tax=Pseudonocardia sp. TRM90224 TaxID=2812678 RepID=UPI001E3163AB|nr:alpha/beta hydrolase [Pseudonocardia sp. TRM90224]